MGNDLLSYAFDILSAFPHCWELDKGNLLLQKKKKGGGYFDYFW